MSRQSKRSTEEQQKLLLFASRLRRLRDENGISQDKLALITGLSRSHIYYLESAQAEPGLLTLITIANALQVDIIELVKDLEIEQPYIPSSNLSQ